MAEQPFHGAEPGAARQSLLDQTMAGLSAAAGFDGIVDPARAAELAHTRYAFEFGAAGIVFASSVACEIVLELRIAEVPNAPAPLRGITNVRGNLIPVFDLHALLGETGPERSSARLLVIDRGDHAAAVPLDGNPVTLRTDRCDADAPTAPPAPLAPFVTGDFRIDGRTWWEMDHAALFRHLGGRAAAA